MINKRLTRTVPESRWYILRNVLLQWVSLCANIVLMAAVAHALQDLFWNQLMPERLNFVMMTGAGAIAVRMVCTVAAGRMSYLSSKAVKSTLRELIYRKLLALGSSYQEQVNTSEVVQVAVEGVDQLETYFGQYLPQFFYAMLAPVTLFGVLCFVSLPSALVLLLCVPLIPVTIVLVQRWAKKLLSKYWGQYTALGDTFLENLQGLTTTKIYQTDEYQHRKMNEQSEHFRRITMKVLTMQLNSITIMDIIAYGGSALGVILAVTQLRNGQVDLAGCLLIILLAADFFLPMRLLGSFFHIAMNGMAAADKIFRLLDLPEQPQGTEEMPAECHIEIEDLNFGYNSHRQILNNVSLEFPAGSFTALVGESGCGKSTLAAILMGRHQHFSGAVRIGGKDISQISRDSLLEHITYVGHQDYLFKGTVRENLQMANERADDAMLWQVLKQVNLADFLESEQGLDTPLLEKAANLSGGQRQRLALARALLHDSPVYIFDEATSNIDVESENEIMHQIHRLAERKTVILISHRLANVCGADRIYVLEQGRIAEAGTHQNLLRKKGSYAKLWNAQQALEQDVKAGAQ